MNSCNFSRNLTGFALSLGLSFLCFTCAANAATPPASSKAVKEEGGKYFDANGDPTYKISPDGKVDWYTFSGFRRFNGTCDVCHGPDGAGSSFGPDLTQALKSLDYSQFVATVSGGKRDCTEPMGAKNRTSPVIIGAAPGSSLPGSSSMPNLRASAMVLASIFELGSIFTI